MTRPTAKKPYLSISTTFLITLVGLVLFTTPVFADCSDPCTAEAVEVPEETLADIVAEVVRTVTGPDGPEGGQPVEVTMPVTEEDVSRGVIEEEVRAVQEVPVEGTPEEEVREVTEVPVEEVPEEEVREVEEVAVEEVWITEVVVAEEYPHQDEMAAAVAALLAAQEDAAEQGQEEEPIYIP